MKLNTRVVDPRLNFAKQLRKSEQVLILKLIGKFAAGFVRLKELVSILPDNLEKLEIWAGHR